MVYKEFLVALDDVVHVLDDLLALAVLLEEDHELLDGEVVLEALVAVLDVEQAARLAQRPDVGDVGRDHREQLREQLVSQLGVDRVHHVVVADLQNG